MTRLEIKSVTTKIQSLEFKNSHIGKRKSQ